ncbi:dihydroneopterin aldolase [Candidatus Bipolaricaulota bacterium]|nr:dihydroneopterin aldolase [Candidatus Bipolaricaulota bacterium]
MSQNPSEEEMDKIRINDLSVGAIIGTEDYERESRQELILSVTVYTDLERAGNTDGLEYTLDYSELESRIRKMVRKSSFQLLEALAEEVAGLALGMRKAKKVKVSVKKPAALNMTRSAEVEITREG